MLSKEKRSFSNSEGFVNFTLLLVLTLILFVAFVLAPKRSLSQSTRMAFVLSDEEENVPEEEIEKEDQEDTDGDDMDENDDNDEDADEIEELEFEDEDEDGDIEEQGEDEEKLVEGDSEQRVEIEVEDGKVKVKIKTKNINGQETEEELEAEDSSNIASLKLKVKNGEVKLKVRTEDGNIVLVEEEMGGETFAITDLPITLDSENNIVGVQTSMGFVNITEFPAEVLKELMSSDALNQLKSLELKVKTEGNKTKVVYHAKGEDNVMFLGLFKVRAEVEAEVDASTGDQRLVSQPWYLKYLGFLFSS